MSCKLQLAKDVTILPGDNNVDTNLFARWPLFIIVSQLRPKLEKDVWVGTSSKKNQKLRTQCSWRIWTPTIRFRWTCNYFNTTLVWCIQKSDPGSNQYLICSANLTSIHIFCRFKSRPSRTMSTEVVCKPPVNACPVDVCDNWSTESTPWNAAECPWLMGDDL